MLVWLFGCAVWSDDFDAHRAGGATDLQLGCFEVVGVEVGKLDRRDRCDSVAALYALTKSMIAMPCGPSAVPTGGAGLALPASIWILTTVTIFFFAMALSFWMCG